MSYNALALPTLVQVTMTFPLEGVGGKPVNGEPCCKIKLTRAATGGKTGVEVVKMGDNVVELATEVSAAFDQLTLYYTNESPNI